MQRQLLVFATLKSTTTLVTGAGGRDNLPDDPRVAVHELVETPDIMVPLRAAAAVFPTLPKISIDFAVMERTDRAFVVPVACDCDDIGDWAALERLPERDADANTVVGQHVAHEARGNIVYTQDAGDVIITVGVHDLVVVKHGNTVLLVAKDRVADLKRLLGDERSQGAAPRG